MEELLNKLFSYDNFSLYLTIAIVVLIILFIIILFFGKKDQKERELEATKRLQQINEENTFKEESEVAKVEIAPNTEKLENDTIIVPKIEDIKVDNNGEIESNNEQETVLPIINNDLQVEENNNPFNEPIFEKVEETPLVLSDTVEENHEEVNVPVFNFDTVIKDAEEVKKEEEIKKEEEVPLVNPQIFSSVYAPQKEEDEDVEMELPSLKKEEEVIEKPILNDYNLNDLSGETYNINKE